MRLGGHQLRLNFTTAKAPSQDEKEARIRANKKRWNNSPSGRAYRRGVAFHKRAEKNEAARRKRATLEEKQKGRFYKIQHRYGIPVAQVQALVEWWDNGCGYCDRVDTRLVLDHDHTTGYFRAFACHNCNIIIGHAQDSPERLRQIADRLEPCSR